MDPLGELAELPQRLLELDLALGEELLARRVDVAAEELEPHAEREEPLLGAVVQIALEPPPLLVAGADDPGPRLSQLVELCSELGLEPLILERESCRGPAASSSAGWSTRSWSWTTTASRSPMYVACRPSPGGRWSGSPCSSTQASPIGQPEADLERRVADSPRERVAHLPRLDVVQLDDEIADVAARSLDEEEPRESDHPEDAEGHEDHRVLLE